MSSPVEVDLIRSAFLYCKATSGETPVRITITLASGGRRSLTIPAAGLAFANQQSLESWPPPSGWGFRQGEASYEGQVFPVNGKAFAVLKCLAARPGGVNTSELKRDAWDDLQTDDRTVQNTISLVRNAIRRGLGLGVEVDPVSADGGKYRLDL